MTSLKRMFDDQRAKCRELFEEYNASSAICPPDYDKLHCWPATPSGSIVSLPCPFSSQRNKIMTRWCMASMTKAAHRSDNASVEWCPIDDSECSPNLVAARSIHPFPTITLLDEQNSDLYWWHLQLYSIVRAGYVVSIISLLLALLIFASFPRLWFTRVKIHNNLFISMGLQAIMWFTQSLLFGHQIFLSLITEDAMTGDWPSVSCRVLMVLGNYFKLTSFSWTLMESWYFYHFICRSPYNEMTNIKLLVIFGWGAPLTVIVPYVIVYSLTSETNFCWVDVDVKTNLLAVPIFVMVLISFCFFVVNVRVLFIKLNCTILHERKKNFWKWLRSTLTLVPLFGAHDVFFCAEPWIEDKQTKVHFYNAIRLVCSLHGFIIAILHCFISKEVHGEIQRTWKIWKSKSEINSNQIRRRLKVTSCQKKSDCQTYNTEVSSLNSAGHI